MFDATSIALVQCHALSTLLVLRLQDLVSFEIGERRVRAVTEAVLLLYNMSIYLSARILALCPKLAGMVTVRIECGVK